LTHDHESIILMVMMKRMQVLIEEKEFRVIREIARKRGMTVADWVRQALRASYRDEPLGDRDRKLAAVRASLVHDFPTADIGQMIEEISRGYGDS